MLTSIFKLRNVVAIAISLAAMITFTRCTTDDEVLSSEKEITSFKFNAPPAVGVIDQDAKTIAVVVPAGTNVTSMAPVITVSAGASVNPASGTIQDFSGPVHYTVTAVDGSKATYTVTVNVEGTGGSSAKQITAFSFVNPPATGIINETAKTIAVEVPFGTNVTALVPTISVSPGATVSPASGVAQNFSNPVLYTVTAADNSTATYTVTVNLTGSGGTPTPLTSTITANTTLPDLGLPIDYTCNIMLQVQNNALLTIEPGVTIQFTATGAGIRMNDGTQIVAIGTAAKPIKFIGVGSNKGSWQYIDIYSSTDNTFKYCDFINGGSGTGWGVVNNYGGNAKVSMENCNISGSLGYGYYISSTNVQAVMEFKNNTITGCDKAPVYVNTIYNAQKFDATSIMTGNVNDYVHIANVEMSSSGSNVTLNKTSVAYYFAGSSKVYKLLTINQGAKIYMNVNSYLDIYDSSGGALVVNGTATEPVTFSRAPGGANYYWGAAFGGIVIEGNGGSSLTWCVIEHVAGNGGINIWNSASNVDLNNVTIRNNQKYGVYFGGNGTVTHSGVNDKFSNNALGNVRLYDGTVSPTLP
ncbi:MAG: DUF5018 domain-containing protein [Flavobacteriaceae bacterium]|nr:DUF5018 domain-containing protein [Flavobacteriaceae bacterium]